MERGYMAGGARDEGAGSGRRRYCPKRLSIAAETGESYEMALHARLRNSASKRPPVVSKQAGRKARLARHRTGCILDGYVVAERGGVDKNIL